MMPSIYQRKRTQDAMRRQQQADEHIRKLEERIEKLENALSTVQRGLEHIAERTKSTTTRQDAVQGINAIERALDGGGDDHE